MHILIGILQNKFRAIVLKRAYGEQFCALFSKDRCNKDMKLDRDLFENKDDVKLFIELVQDYGEQNLALFKVYRGHVQNVYGIISGFLQRPLSHTDPTRAHHDRISIYWECWRSIGALHGIFHGVYC